MFEKPKLHDREELNGVYKDRGFQKMSFNEYMLVKKQQERSKFRLPPALQFILTTPFLILFCFGLVFIPYMIYQFAKALSSPATIESSQTTLEKSNKNK